MNNHDMDTPMTKDEFISLVGEDPEDVFGADWENDIADLIASDIGK